MLHPTINAAIISTAANREVGNRRSRRMPARNPAPSTRMVKAILLNEGRTLPELTPNSEPA